MGGWRKEEEKLKGEIVELLRRGQAVDEAVDEHYGAERWGDGLPEELQRREDRLKKIEEAKQRLEERQKEEDRAAGRNENDGGWASGVSAARRAVTTSSGVWRSSGEEAGELHRSREPDHENPRLISIMLQLSSERYPASASTRSGFSPPCASAASVSGTKHSLSAAFCIIPPPRSAAILLPPRFVR